jgi:hypothetical protein
MKEFDKKDAVQVEISKLLRQIPNKSIENVVRKIIFAHAEVIDWETVYKILKLECPKISL